MWWAALREAAGSDVNESALRREAARDIEDPPAARAGAIASRRYHLPTDQGYEFRIAGRMAARAEARAAAKASGKMPLSRIPAPEVTHHAGDGLMKTRETNRKKLADTEKRDAGS